MFLQHEKKIKCFKKISYSQLSHFLYNMSIPSSAYLERDALTKKSLCHYSSSVILSLSYFLICVLIILSSNNYVLLLREIPLICCLLFSWSVVSNFLRPHGLQHARLLFSPSPSPRVCSNSCPLSQWCYPTISSSVAPFSSCIQSFPASRWLFTSGGQSTGASASASIFPINIQGWFPLGLIDLISLQSKGCSRVFSNTTVQIHYDSYY